MAQKRLSKPKPFSKKALNTIPNQSGIYVLKDKNNKPLYVGRASAGRLKNRLGEHINLKDIRGAKQVQIRTTSSTKEAERLEKRYVKRLNPKYNKQLNVKK